MRVTLAHGPLAEVEADVLVVSAPRGGELRGAAQELDPALGGALSQVVEDGAFNGASGTVEWIFPAPVKSRRVLVIGAGKDETYDVRMLRRLAAVAIRQARSKKARSVCFAMEAPPGVSSERLAEVVVDGALTGLFEPDLYKGSRKESTVEEISVWVPEGGDAAQAGLERGQKIAAAVNFGRWLSEEPANIMNPVRAAEEAQKVASTAGLECEVLDVAGLQAAGMGSLLSVAQGSQWPPRVVVLTYRGGGDAPMLGLVGKGVTFDTGGISIKPALDMHYMKYDMCGAAAVVSTILALAQLKAKVNVVAVAGFVENMPGGRATKPGDVVKAANGKTVEIINTDAEGRLVLIDALDLARKRGATRLVDAATLTGAIKVTLGTVATGVMGEPQEWVDQVIAAAGRAGERIWQLPLFPEYKDQLKSNIADLVNTGGRFGGSITAAVFIQQFVGDTPWAHLDIAGTAWTEKDSSSQTRGATGVMVRTLVELAESGS